MSSVRARIWMVTAEEKEKERLNRTQQNSTTITRFIHYIFSIAQKPSTLYFPFISIFICVISCISLNKPQVN